jgi:hypothetical protein
MKRCPRCGQIYTDDLLYCLQDGNELLPEYAETETPTVVRPPRPASQPAGKPYLKYLAIALVALLAMGIAGAAGAYFVWSKLSSGDDRPSGDPTPRPSPTAPAQPTRTPAFQNKEPQDTPTNVERPTPPRNSANTNVTPNDDESDFVDPGTTRINFRRGRVSETVSGRISEKRDFVLRTLTGQYLTARVTSDRDCVLFADGMSETEYVTPQGDSRLSLRNNCRAPVRFSLRVTVR